MNLTLKRTSIEEAGCFGEYYDDKGNFLCFSMERTYDPGNTIKIPAGIWKCVPSVYNRGGYKTFEVIIPKHTRILHHKANVELDLDGCIGLGLSIGMIGVNASGHVAKPGEAVARNVKAVLQSGAGFAKWWQYVKDLPGFELEVINPVTRELRSV